ncbi:hypothetical protein A3Q56_05600 [Intoshia linei]|uniref:Uncharacterized protein n=1 Tax=Intoshia linei TaxID=1819745 RepID=A0A177AXF4_9BILA|nr:hypothetical protein A3Q56_05600 [Intoshia linei]
MSIRNSPTCKNGVSPAEILYGKNLKLPLHDLNYPVSKHKRQHNLNIQKSKHNKNVKFYYDKKALNQPSTHSKKFKKNHPILSKN